MLCGVSFSYYERTILYRKHILCNFYRLYQAIYILYNTLMFVILTYFIASSLRKKYEAIKKGGGEPVVGKLQKRTVAPEEQGGTGPVNMRTTGELKMSDLH